MPPSAPATASPALNTPLGAPAADAPVSGHGAGTADAADSRRSGAPTAPAVEPRVEQVAEQLRQLHMQIMSTCSPETFRAALASVYRTPDPGGSSADDDWPLAPLQLNLAPAAEGEQGGSGSDGSDSYDGNSDVDSTGGADQDGSDAVLLLTGQSSPQERWDQGFYPAHDFRSGFLSGGDYYGRPEVVDEVEADEADPAEGGDEDEVVDDQRAMVVHNSRKDPYGILQYGQSVYCKVHDLGRPATEAPCVCDLLQQQSVRAVIDKHRARRARQNRQAPRRQRGQPQHRTAHPDPDGREARFALYRAIVKAHFASPLGAGNRVRLPMCLLKAVRRLFPNPECVLGVCDFGAKCERAGHYTGFRSAEESRARAARGDSWTCASRVARSCMTRTTCTLRFTSTYTCKRYLTQQITTHGRAAPPAPCPSRLASRPTTVLS